MCILFTNINGYTKFRMVLLSFLIGISLWLVPFHYPHDILLHGHHLNQARSCQAACLHWFIQATPFYRVWGLTYVMPWAINILLKTHQGSIHPKAVIWDSWNYSANTLQLFLRKYLDVKLSRLATYSYPPVQNRGWYQIFKGNISENTDYWTDQHSVL
jgi:hypothetical protein